MTKSPLAGALTCSNSRGIFAAKFKRTGFDAIIFTGKSDKPVSLWIDHGNA
jgi:aldehyde:ferredoxin oxidoreductase